MSIKTLSPCPPRWICKSPIFHVPRHTSFSSGLEHMCICIPFPDWWWEQALFCTGQSPEEEVGSIKTEAKRDGCHSLGIGSLPHLRNVLSAVCLIEVLSS